MFPAGSELRQVALGEWSGGSKERVGRESPIRNLAEGMGSKTSEFGPYSTHMNNMRFANDHMFRSQTGMLTGFTPVE